MATATSKLQIVIDVLGDKAERGLKGVKGSLTQIGIAAAAVTAAGLAAKKAWDFAKEGAQLELTATQFDNVAHSAGLFSDALLNKMRQATMGMITDAKLMESGLQIIELGLADSEDGVVRLASVVGTLGLDMQQVIMTFANDSVMRLDALGLSVEKVTQRAKELKAEGFTGDAFDQAVLERLEDRAETLGDTSETTAGKILILETAVQNLKDEAALLAAEFSGPLLTAFVSGIQAHQQLEAAYNSGAISLFEYAELTEYVNRGEEGRAGALAVLAIKTKIYADNLAQLTTEAAAAESVMLGYASSANAVSDALSGGINIANTYADRARNAAQANAEAGAATAIWNRNQSDLNEELLIAGKRYSDISTSVFSLTERLKDQLEFLMAGGGILLELAAQTEAALDRGDFKQAQAGIDDLIIGATDLDLELGNIDTDEAVDRLEDMGYPIAEAKRLVREMQADLFAMTAQDYAVTIHWLNDTSDLPWLVPPSDLIKLREEEYAPPPPPSPPPGGYEPFATGTNGWLQVPGGAGQARNITVHGGEMMNVIPAGQGAGGGGSVNWYGDAIFTTSGEAMSFIAQMQSNAGRNSRSMAAGAAGVG